MSQYKILCTGNPKCRSISQAVEKSFPNVDCISRSNGFDLTTSKGLDKFRFILKNYNVLINSSYIEPGTQLKILELAHELEFNGHIFNIGSMAEFKNLSHLDPDYSIEKQQLRDRSIELLSNQFKTTHLTISGFKDQNPQSDNKMDPTEIVNAIQWVLTSTVAIPHLSIIDLTCLPST